MTMIMNLPSIRVFWFLGERGRILHIVVRVLR